MAIKPGTQLMSPVTSTQVVVVRAPGAEVEIGCAGAAMVPVEAGEPAGTTAAADDAEPVALGKRYVDEETGLELLCTKAGAGPLTCEGRPLLVKGAKPLPSSD